VFFAAAKNVQKVYIHNNQHLFGSHILGNDQSVSQNDLAVFADINDESYSEDIEDIDLADYGFDHFAFLDSNAVFSFIFSQQSYKPALYANGSHQIVHAATIPLYILFHSMIIPSAN
jgi:hypothetical protein